MATSASLEHVNDVARLWVIPLHQESEALTVHAFKNICFFQTGFQLHYGIPKIGVQCLK